MNPITITLISLVGGVLLTALIVFLENKYNKSDKSPVVFNNPHSARNLYINRNK